MNRRLLVCAFCGALSLLAIGSASFAQFLPGGGIDTTDPVLPPAGVYLSPDDVHAMYTGANLQIVLSAIQHQPFKDLPPRHVPPGQPVANEEHDFQSVLVGQGQCIGQGCIDNGIPPTFPVMANGRVQTVAVGKGPGDTTGQWPTEMTGMNLTFGPAMIRESPTLPSLGLTQITSTGPGTYHIDSFFDVFTELSLDGGTSWIPSAGPTHVNLVPEPASIGLVAIALIGFAGFVRRRK